MYNKALKYITFLLLYCSLFAPNSPEKLDIDILGYLYVKIPDVETNSLHIKDGIVVKSHKGAIGLYQVMPEALWDVNKKANLDLPNEALNDKNINSYIGQWIIYDLIKKYSLVKAINSYNMGENSKWINTNYIAKVMGNEYINGFIENKTIYRISSNRKYIKIREMY